MKITMITALTLLFIPVCAAASVDASASLEEQGQVLIYPLPSDLKIYFGPVDPWKTKLDDLDGDWLNIYDKVDNKHYLITEENLVGEPPIVLNDVAPGHYLIAVEPVYFHRGGIAMKNGDPFLQAAAVVTPISVSDPGGWEKWQAGDADPSGTMIYVFEKKADRKGVVVLHAKESYSLEELDAAYPRAVNFTLDEARLTAALEAEQVTSFLDAAEVASVLDLLARGGKVIAEKGEIRFLIDVTDDQEYSVRTQARRKKNGD